MAHNNHNPTVSTLVQSSTTTSDSQLRSGFNKIAINNKVKWTPNEDIQLLELVNQYGMKNWSLIAKLMGGRWTRIQCRDRCINHLCPNIKKDSWTLEEDKILIKAHQEVGSKWTKIAKRLPGRTENTIKNHWNNAKRRRTCNEGSLLHAYIRKFTTAEEPTKKFKNTISEMKMNSNLTVYEKWSPNPKWVSSGWWKH